MVVITPQRGDAASFCKLASVPRGGVASSCALKLTTRGGVASLCALKLTPRCAAIYSVQNKKVRRKRPLIAACSQHCRLMYQDLKLCPVERLRSFVNQNGVR